jgi:hypothetical protein
MTTALFKTVLFSCDAGKFALRESVHCGDCGNAAQGAFSRCGPVQTQAKGWLMQHRTVQR